MAGNDRARENADAARAEASEAQSDARAARARARRNGALRDELEQGVGLLEDGKEAGRRVLNVFGLGGGDDQPSQGSGSYPSASNNSDLQRLATALENVVNANTPERRAALADTYVQLIESTGGQDRTMRIPGLGARMGFVIDGETYKITFPAGITPKQATEIFLRAIPDPEAAKLFIEEGLDINPDFARGARATGPTQGSVGTAPTADTQVAQETETPEPRVAREAAAAAATEARDAAARTATASASPVPNASSAPAPAAGSDTEDAGQVITDRQRIRVAQALIQNTTGLTTGRKNSAAAADGATADEMDGIALAATTAALKDIQTRLNLNDKSGRLTEETFEALNDPTKQAQLVAAFGRERARETQVAREATAEDRPAPAVRQLPDRQLVPEPEPSGAQASVTPSMASNAVAQALPSDFFNKFGFGNVGSSNPSAPENVVALAQGPSQNVNIGDVLNNLSSPTFTAPREQALQQVAGR